MPFSFGRLTIFFYFFVDLFVSAVFVPCFVFSHLPLNRVEAVVVRSSTIVIVFVALS